MPKILRREISSEWGKECQKDINRLDDIWKERTEGTKNAFDKDKAFIQRKANLHENNTNEEYVSNTEGNSNNRNWEKRDTTNPRRHNTD